MDDKVVVFVPLEWELEFHVGEQRVRVDPPDPLGLRVGYHRSSNHRKLRPEGEHFGLEQRVIVEDVVAVDSAVVDLVLEES